LVGLIGLSVLGAEDADAKRKHRRRRRQRKARRGSSGLRSIKVTVGNPNTNPQTSEIELGYSRPRDPVKGECCQGAAGYSLPPGQSAWWSSESTNAYVWIENRYFIRFDNPGIGVPFLNTAIDGAPTLYDPSCCKPRGQDLERRLGLDEGEATTLNFNGRSIRVQRLADEDDYKSFFVTL
jgi:hypothetical protein